LTFCFINLVLFRQVGLHTISHASIFMTGTVLDLPYRFTADGEVMERTENFDFDNMLAVGLGLCCLFELLSCLTSALFDF